MTVSNLGDYPYPLCFPTSKMHISHWPNKGRLFGKRGVSEVMRTLVGAGCVWTAQAASSLKSDPRGFMFQLSKWHSEPGGWLRSPRLWGCIRALQTAPRGLQHLQTEPQGLQHLDRGDENSLSLGRSRRKSKDCGVLGPKAESVSGTMNWSTESNVAHMSSQRRAENWPLYLVTRGYYW